jgi:hypothetical protein
MRYINVAACSHSLQQCLRLTIYDTSDAATCHCRTTSSGAINSLSFHLYRFNNTYRINNVGA